MWQNDTLRQKYQHLLIKYIDIFNHSYFTVTLEITLETLSQVETVIIYRKK